MQLIQEEIDWLRLAIEDNYNYRVSVDNDCVFIDKRIDDDIWVDWECVFTFNNYGYEFIVQLLNYIGCNAELV